MKKRIQKSLCALLALVMLLSIVPVSSVSAAPAGERLDGWNETLYDFLKTNVAAVANGDQASTEFTLSDTNGIMKWSKEDLGVSTLISGNSIAAEAQTALIAKFSEAVDLDAIMHSLLADCPYDLYWYDKVTGVNMSYNMSAGSNEMKITRITFKLAVCQDYSVSQYTVDTDLMKSVASITDNAMAIVEKHADKSDWDKLIAYKDEICELVSYNHTAANNPSTPYGNPWQLIYVFDMNPSTNVVCEGYAKAFKLLCDLTNFQNDVYCYTVTGYMQGGTGAGDHMWNVVDINGGRLMVDVTNCDDGTIGAPDQLFLTAGTKYGDSYSFPAGNSTIYYTYDPNEYGLYTDGYLELTPVPEQEEDPEISPEPTTPIDPLAIKFDEIVGYCDTFYESIPWYVVCKLSWDLIDWNYDGEPPVLQIPAAEYEAAAAKYCVLTESMLNAIRNETDYEGNRIYDPETNTYTVFFVGGWGGFLHNRVYAGYVKTGEDTYDVYYMTINYEFLDEILPDGTSLEDVVGEDWPEKVEYEGYTYTNGPDGYFRIAGYSKSGIKYGVKYDGENVMIATRTPYSVGQQPENFDDITIEDILTYEIVDGEAIITDCADFFSGEITIPNTLGGYPVTTIGEFAFAHLTNPISVNTGNSVKTISNAAFLGCYGLESITLGDSVQSVDMKAFEACDNLQSFAVSANNPNYSSVNGVLYNKNQTVLFCAPKTLSGEFTIPAGVLTVGEYAFDGCMYLTDLIFGNDVTTISKRAFNNCMNLTNVKLGSSVKTIDEYAFMNCSRINKLIAPLSLTDIKDHAFERCTGLTDIYYAGTQSQWIAVNIGGNNEPIDNATIHYESDGSAPADPSYLTFEIINGEAVITGCDSSISGSLELPAVLGGYPVTTIAMNAFLFSQITDITLPETLTTIEGNAFAWSAISSIYIPAGVHTINSAAFNGCTDFTGYTVSQDNPYFSSDSYGVLFNKPMTELISAPCALTGTYYVPDTVTTIPTGAFMGCEKLENLYIPQSATNLAVSGGSFFKGCTNLQGVWVDPKNPTYRSDEYGALLSKDNWYLYYVPNTLNGTYQVPDGVVYVDHAFDECAYLSGIYFPEGVGNISADFSQCVSLKRLYIPASLSTMNFRLYELYEYQADIYYAGTLEQWDSIYSLDSNMHPGNLNIVYNCAPAIWNLSWYISDGGAYINSCDQSIAGVVIIPDTLGGYPVVGIDDKAFQYCYGITEIHLPQALTTIGNYAFEHCTNLTTVTMGDSVTSIGNYAFHYCSALDNIELSSSLTAIGDYTFSDCTNLREITIPNNVTRIGQYAFNNCSSLSTIEIPSSVNTIDNYAFKKCTSITEVNFPIGVTTLGDYAFSDCGNLKTVSLPNSLTTIGYGAFSNCNKLEWINIPGSVTNFGEYIFQYSGPKTVIFEYGITTIPANMFYRSSVRNVTLADSVIRIESGAFRYCDYQIHVYYLGTEMQMSNIAIYDETLAASVWHCNSCIGAAEHTYDNGCDTQCNICMSERVAPHEFDNTCDSTCNLCPYTRETSHNFGSGVVTKPATCKEAGIMTYTCSGCQSTKTETIEQLTTHTYVSVTTKATLTEDGKIESKCSGCGKVASTTIIKAPKTFTLSATSYIYDGKAKTPNVTVIDANGKSLLQGTDYTVTYASGRTALGSYNVTITMKGNYSGTKTLSFSIKLASPKATATNAATGVNVTWNAIAGAKNYTVYRSTYTNGAWSSWKAIKTGVTGTSYTDTGVKSGTTVRYTVKPYNGSHTASCVTGGSTIFLSQATVKAANAATGVKVTWDKITGAKSYVVYRSVYSNGKWSGWTKIASSITGTTYTDTGVKSGSNVRYTVKAVNGSYASICKTGGSTIFLSQATVKAANAATGVKVTWDKITGAKSYVVYRSVYSNGKWSGWTKIASSITGTSYTDTGVKSGSNVRYTVKAVNGNYASVCKTGGSTIFLSQATAKATNAATGVKVTWDKITGAKSYVVYRSVCSNGKWSNWTKIKSGVTGTSYTDTGVKSGSTVRYTVKAVNGSYASVCKNGNTIKFLAQPKVTVTKASNGIKASWGKVTGATGYIVYRRTYTNGAWSGWTKIKTTTATSYTDTTAKKGVTYQYMARAYSGDYKSSYTNSTSIKR